MKKILKETLMFFLVCMLVVIGMIYFSNLTERKDSKNKFNDFYVQEEDFDVLFLGSSHVINGIFPMELWREYGMVSYNMAGHGNRMPMNYWILKNALEYTTPKLVVIDGYLVSADDKISSEELLHISVDHVPFSRTKLETIRDLVDDKERQWDFLWKYSTYHNRWSDLNTIDFDFNCSVEKGAETNVAVAIPNDTIFVDSSKKMDEDAIGVEYLRKTIEECQSQNIEVLLTYIPFPDDSGQGQIESNTIKGIADEYNVNYLDYYVLKEQLNFDTDCADSNSHLNPSGARKITRYIGDFICTKYFIEDHRETGNYSEWHEAYQKYKNDKYNKLRNTESIANYLMLLSDTSLSYGIWLKHDINWEAYPIMKELLANIGIDYSRMTEEHEHLVMIDNIQHQQNIITESESLETSFGKIDFIKNEKNEIELNCNNSKKYFSINADIGIVVFDNENFEIVDIGVFEMDKSKVSSKRHRN